MRRLSHDLDGIHIGIGSSVSDVGRMADSEKICFCPLIGANERPREYAIISVTSPADFCTGEKNLAQGSHIEDVPSSIQESERIGTRPPESGFSIASFAKSYQNERLFLGISIGRVPRIKPLIIVRG